SSVVPSSTCTVTGVSSLAVPEKDGLRLFDGVVGWLRVTSGGSVSTSNVSGPALPSGLPAKRLFSVATAVNGCLPGGSGLLRPLVVHLPPEAAVAAAATSVEPSKTCTTT